MSIIRLEKLLHSSPRGRLNKIVRTAQSMEDLTLLLRRSMDPETAQNLVAASVRDDGELTLVCSSPAWASRLRFDSEAILKVAKDHGIGASRCRVCVARQDGA